MEITRTAGMLISVCAGLALIAFNIALGADAEAGPVISTLFLLPLLVAGINHPLYDFNFSLTAAYNFVLLLLNDLLIRLFRNEYEGWITKSFFIALGLSVIIMVFKAFALGKSGRTFGKCPVSRSVLVLIGAAITVLIYRTWIESGDMLV